MKIAILIDTFLPYKGGGQIFVWEVARRLAQKDDVQINIVTRKITVNGKRISENETYFNGKLKVTRLGFCASWNNLISRGYYIAAAFLYLLKNKFDLIDAQAFIASIPGKLVAIIKRQPIILTVHGTTMETGGASFLEKFILTKIKYDTQISAASNFLKFKNVNKNITIVNPGVDTNFYKPNLSLKKNNRVLFVGRLQKIKGTEVLLRCFDTLKQERYKFIVVGDGEEMEEIKKYIQEKSISNVELKGELTEKEVLLEYQKATVFLLPSLSEGFPLTILEAMACGLPVVASNVGDVTKIIVDGNNGFVVKPGVVSLFAEKIKLILNNQDMAQKMSKNNILKAKQYSWDKTARGIYRVYLNTVSMKKYD